MLNRDRNVELTAWLCAG